MRALHPAPDPPDLGRHYAYPAGLTRPWVRAMMVSSADGAVEHGGRSGGIATPADRSVFALLRRTADVVLVGAGTARAEDYRGVRGAPGGGPAPPLAVVTRSAELDPGARLFTDTHTAPIVLTAPPAPRDRRDALAAAGADVAVLQDTGPSALLAELDRRGLRRVLCEGGPALLGALLDGDAVDELCLTVAPTLLGGPAGRIAASERAVPRPMTLAGVLEQDGTLLLRYVRTDRAPTGTPPNG